MAGGVTGVAASQRLEGRPYHLASPSLCKARRHEDQVTVLSFLMALVDADHEMLQLQGKKTNQNPKKNAILLAFFSIVSY